MVHSPDLGTLRGIRGYIRHLMVSRDVRQHRLISLDYIKAQRCHGRGRGFESRRPRQIYKAKMIFL